MKLWRHQLFLLFLSVSVLITSQTFAAKTISLASTEREPYIGNNLPAQGYVHELVTECFKRMGYKVNIKYFPLARAKYITENGKVDGLLPYYFEESLSSIFAFSKPFPGDEIGLLKRKDFQFDYRKVFDPNPLKTIENLNSQRIGLVRGDSSTIAFEKIKNVTIDYARDDLMNIDKLEKKRIPLIVIDKYTAADLLVNKRPHFIGNLEFINPPLFQKSFHVAFSKKKKDYHRVKADFDKGLISVTKDGTLAKILYKHGLQRIQSTGTNKNIVRIGTVNNGDMIVMQRLSKQFEKLHPDIKLEWSVLDENILRTRLLADLAISDGRYDVMTIGSYETPIWAKRKWLTPITKFPRDYDLDDIIKPVRDALSYAGNLFAIPFYAESSMMFYRKDLFKSARLKINDHPTYDDIKRFAAAIHNPQKKIYGICIRGKAGWGENMALLSIMVNTFGGQWFNTDWKPMIDTAEWKNAVTTYKELLTKYGPPSPYNNGFSENLKLFANGHCGMWIDATVAAGMLFNPKISKVYDKLGFAPAPISVTPKGSQWLWSWALAIPQSSKKKDAAFKFITWASSKDYIKLVAKSEGWVAVPPGTRISTYKNTKYIGAAPFASFVLNAIQKADPVDSTLHPKSYKGIQYVDIPEFPAIGRAVGLEMVEMLKGNTSISKALKKSQKLVEDQMRRSGY